MEQPRGLLIQGWHYLFNHPNLKLISKNVGYSNQFLMVASFLLDSELHKNYQ